MQTYSGRFDQYADEQDMIDFFYDLLIKFDCEDALMTFEDKTKAGLPCKPHYHFVFKSPETSREKIRKYISKNPELKGTCSSLKVCDNYDKALCYILKQYHIHQYIPFSDYDSDELQDFITISQNYNKDLVVFNSFKDHVDYLIETIHKEYADKIPSRLDLVQSLGEYVYNWNSDTKNKPINLPTNIKQTIVYMETRILPKKEFMTRYLIDNTNLIYDHDMKDYFRKKDTQYRIIHTTQDSKYFEDSDNEADNELIEEKSSLDI